ncbi:uncharacterized protein BDR25DRAFT_297914 [Lindgomyces ingoldianus]|uniref:Uncharacterized protein n=1 Tax=Lindgomyces ingoldianus TaxID=673940 RepID=A0ACB6Q941_9PLEO|nr:uncharacterized protein BDR25DRAFT_297914 [Lindgomyces ingoldianus]KAF2463559.1 hypothetical protein BDR25DRAFT_297914 [Lindgomyces ingoldianus]
MSFGVSPSDVIKLVEFSTRIYIAFKDANDNSEAQVEALIKEFSTFHHCLVQLDELMREYGKPLPFPYLDFKETLQKCQTTLKPYADNLVDHKRMTVKKFTYTIRYIGKETELDRLRKQITGHYQALQMCISFLQLRLHLEATKQTQRLLDSAPFRSMSFGGQMYSTYALGSGSAANRNALPAPSEADQLYKDWLVFNRWLRNEDERIAREGDNLTRPLSYGATPAITPSGDAETAAVLYHLRRELEDAIMVEENRAKRVAVEKRSNLSPSDAIRQEVRDMPQIPQRTFTLDSDMSLTAFDGRSVADSSATIRPTSIISPNVSPRGSPQIEQGPFAAIDWGNLSSDPSRASSVSTNRSSFSATSPDSRPGVSSTSTVGTTPDDRPLRAKFSVSSLATIALGDGALEWNKLCRKVQVERSTSKTVESRECDVHWRYREDHGLSIRSVYRDERTKKVQVWIAHHFPATGPSIPLSTSYADGDVSIDFPRSSFGRLDKRCTDIKYTFGDHESSKKLQTLLYTNNGKDQADLLFDRPIITISSNKNKPECRGKNIRLWRRREKHEDFDGVISVDVLVLLFYTSALPQDHAHWVEEPHYGFEWLDDATYKKNSEKLQLVFSKDPGKWTRDKLFKRRKSSKGFEGGGVELGALARMNTATSVASSSAFSIRSSKSEVFGCSNRSNNLNRFGYSELKIEFQSKKDRKEFVAVWRQFLKPLGFIEGNS